MMIWRRRQALSRLAQMWAVTGAPNGGVAAQDGGGGGGDGERKGWDGHNM